MGKKCLHLSSRFISTSYIFCMKFSEDHYLDHALEHKKLGFGAIPSGGLGPQTQL